ncbi:ABC transporter permease [Lacticaseibacillus mingshuiensis]|uniref:ABC transporter permease n=1 Tax=Lacticaseibacillus mingshuiensis TaxID=2799574 RepID=A0ABW4CGM0_9LACO|nr:ABC transporter permease [Lacticaseibacillus mingshuiensis]
MADIQMPKALQWVRLLRPLLEKYGVDYRQYCLVVRTKYEMAARSQNGIGLTMQTNGPKKPSANPMRTSFLVNLLIGGVIALLMALYAHTSLMTQLTTLFSTLFIMFFLTMLTSYSTLILDPRDRQIFTVRGVSGRTLNLARLSIVGMFLLLTILSLGGPSLIVIAMSQQNIPLVLGTLLGALLLALFCFVLSLFLYLLVLRFFDGERLKNILNILQIVIAIGFYISAQLPNLLGADVLAKFNFTIPNNVFFWWYLPAVPVWFAGPGLLMAGVFAPSAWLLTVLAVVVPAVLLVIYLKHAGRFEQYLEKLEQSDATSRKNGWWFTLSRRVLTANSEEATYYTLGWRMLQYEREYKLRVYPQLAYGLIIPLIMGSAFLRNMSWAMAKNFAPYLSVGLILAVPTALMMLRYASQPEAMGIFRFVPFATQGLLLRGIVLAMFARLFLPLLLLYPLAMLAVAPATALTSGLLVLTLSLAVTFLFGRFMVGKVLPFSAEFNATKGMQNGTIGCVTVGLAMVLIFAVIMVGGLVHAWWLDLIGAAIFGVIAWLSWRSYPRSIMYDLHLQETESDQD